MRWSTMFKRPIKAPIQRLDARSYAFNGPHDLRRLLLEAGFCNICFRDMQLVCGKLVAGGLRHCRGNIRLNGCVASGALYLAFNSPLAANPHQQNNHLDKFVKRILRVNYT